MARQFFIKDKNLKPENIKQDVKILNVTGTYEGGGPGDCEEWPSLLSINNAQSPAHAGVIFDTGFPIAGLINTDFEGYFSLGSLETESFFILGNRSNVDPETGHYYYWGIWKYEDKLMVSFGGGGGTSAQFTLGDEVSADDLTISWMRGINFNYGTPDDEFGTEYIYDIKIGNIYKQAPAFDDRLELFEGLNVCVFGRNSSEYPGEYGASAPSGSLCSGLFLSSIDGEEVTHSITLDPYVKNGTVTLYKHYDIDGESVEGPLEPVLHEGAETYNDNFSIDYGIIMEIAPRTEEQHINAIYQNTITPYVTVLPMNLASASETIFENGQVVISADEYGADGLSDITLDISVGGGSDWLTDALAGNITDLSGYELPAPGAEYQYQYLFAYKTAVTDAPDMTNWTSITEDYSCYYMFNQCSNLTGHLDLSSLTSITGNHACERFAGQTSFTSIDLSNLTTINGYQACYYMLAFNTGLQTLNIGSLSSIQGWQAFDQALGNLQYLTTLIVHPYVLSMSVTVGLYTNVNRVANLTLTANAIDDINIATWSLLTADSVLNVLTHLDLTVSGKSVNFYSSGLTVTDDAQGSIQDAYDAAVAAGWTINNLTITPDPGL